MNPWGGRKLAPTIYSKCVAPLFQLAGIQAQVICKRVEGSTKDSHRLVTERSMHAFEIAQTMDMNQFDAAITVSGDGLFHEFVNGLMSREDRQEAARFPIGIIPAGMFSTCKSEIKFTPRLWKCIGEIVGYTVSGCCRSECDQR